MTWYQNLIAKAVRWPEVPNAELVAKIAVAAEHAVQIITRGIAAVAVLLLVAPAVRADSNDYNYLNTLAANGSHLR